MPTRQKIAVLMGGTSREHSVSLKSGQGVMHALDSENYEPIAVLIHPDGAWEISGSRMDIFAGLARIQELAVDCVFIALHGTNGEDGRMQGMLDLLGLPYTGSGCAASALAMDKVRCKAVCSSQGIPMAGHLALDTHIWRADSQAVRSAVTEQLGFPCVIKAACEGSSYGIAIPQSLEEFDAAVERVLEVSPQIMIETYIKGKEVTCAVLDADPNGMIRALPLTEIVPKNSPYFDFEAKYTPGASEEITPARLDPLLTDQVKELAVHAHEIVGCKGWSRSDFIIGDGGPVWIEVNTIPGLTETSLFPQAAAAAGISYPRLITLLIEDALRRAPGKETPAS